jgi:hypothetical protein
MRRARRVSHAGVTREHFGDTARSMRARHFFRPKILCRRLGRFGSSSSDSGSGSEGGGGSLIFCEIIGDGGGSTGLP